MTNKRIILTRNKEHYEHYAKCQEPIENCIICRFVLGNLTQDQQDKHIALILDCGKQ